MYETCLGQSQLLDILAAGRGNVCPTPQISLLRSHSSSWQIISLIPNTSEVLSELSQIGSVDSNRIFFQGSTQGVLPIGPNGVAGFNTMDHSVFDIADIRDSMRSYNYTLNLQGINVDISCEYADQSPIRFVYVDEGSPFTLSYNGTCPEGMDFLFAGGVRDVVVENSMNGVGFWACRAPLSSPSYFIHIRGRGHPERNSYLDTISNISCLASYRSAIYPTTYISSSHLFKANNSTSEGPAISFRGLIEGSLMNVLDVFRDSQNGNSNSVPETVLTYGARMLKLPIQGRHDGYLPLHAAMLKGMLEYGVSVPTILLLW